jgi:hypothetical protein
MVAPRRDAGKLRRIAGELVGGNAALDGISVRSLVRVLAVRSLIAAAPRDLACISSHFWGAGEFGCHLPPHIRGVQSAPLAKSPPGCAAICSLAQPPIAIRADQLASTAPGGDQFSRTPLSRLRPGELPDSAGRELFQPIFLLNLTDPRRGSSALSLKVLRPCRVPSRSAWVRLTRCAAARFTSNETATLHSDLRRFG